MGLFTNPLGYAGYPPGASAPATVVNSTVRAATAAEAATGTLTDVYISPATADSATALDFASPPVLGFGSTTPRPVHATTFSATTAVPVSSGGTGAATLTGVLTGNGTSAVTASAVTNHGVVLGGASNAVSSLGVAATGTVLAGVTGADPAFTDSPSVSGTVTAGTGITSTTGNIVATAGAVSAGTTVTGGTGVVATTGDVTASAGAVNAATTVTATLGAITATNGNLVMGTAGNKIIVPTGANASAGTSGVMAGMPGAVTVATTACSATAKVFYCRNVTGGTMGNVSITAQDGTGFTLTSDANETSTFNWWIINA